MFKLPPLITPCLALLSLTVVSQVRAADSCSVSTVLQPAIDAAAESNTCNADGAYISGTSLAETITARCTKAKNVEKCRGCVKEERNKDYELIRQLIKQGLFDRSDAARVKAALDGLKLTTCGVLPPLNPTPTPTPGGDQPAPTPTPNPKEEIGAQLQIACPCSGTFVTHDSYLKCASNFLGSKVLAGTLSKDKAYEIYYYVQKNTCGVVTSTPTPTATPTSNPI